MADTWITGGRGTMADASNDNGGGFVQGGTATYTTCQGANGGSRFAPMGCNYDDATGVITKADGFLTGLTGVMVNGKTDGGAFPEDWYPITASDAHSITIESGLGDDANIDVWVGGAFTADNDGIDTALDLVAAGDDIQLATNPASGTVYDIAAQITTPATPGTLAAPIKVYGVDYSDGGALASGEDRPILQASEAITSIISFLTTFDYSSWRDIDFDGNSNATYCWHFGEDHESSYHKVNNCRFHNAISHGVHLQKISRYCIYDGNEFDNNGGDGINGYSYYTKHINNDIHDNGSDGAFFGIFVGSSFIYNRVYGNGAKGFYCQSTSANDIFGNTIYDNVGDGIDIFRQAGAYDYAMVIANNNIFSNGGYGINNSNISSEVWPKDIMLLSNNNSWNNTSGHCREMDTPSSEAEWLTFMDGNNITGDPKCVDAANGDFDLLYNSPLIRAGINDSTIGAGSQVFVPIGIDRPDGLVGEPITGTFF